MMSASSTIWAFNAPNEENTEFVYQSVLQGRSRFGWSYVPTADLRTLEERSLSDMTEQEKDCFGKAHFLLQIKPGDWIVHINIPSWGRCVAAKVLDSYKFDPDSPTGDFRHFLPVDPKTVIEFDRNSPNVLPLISRRLKLMGRFWRIHYLSEFLESLENVREDKVTITGDITKQIFYLRSQLNDHLREITEKIQKTHFGKDLEYLV